MDIKIDYRDPLPEDIPNFRVLQFRCEGCGNLSALKLDDDAGGLRDEVDFRRKQAHEAQAKLQAFKSKMRMYYPGLLERLED